MLPTAGLPQSQARYASHTVSVCPTHQQFTKPAALCFATVPSRFNREVSLSW